MIATAPDHAGLLPPDPDDPRHILELLDADGHPCPEVLQTLREGLTSQILDKEPETLLRTFQLVCRFWHPDGSVAEHISRTLSGPIIIFKFMPGGAPGNEKLIAAIAANPALQRYCVSWFRGGPYLYYVPCPEPA